MGNTCFHKHNPVVEPLCVVEFLSKNYIPHKFNRREDKKGEPNGVTGE
jgi:hypothetical protein